MSDGSVPDVEALRVLLEGGAKPEAGDAATMPVLHQAVMHASREHVEALLAGGANPNKRSVWFGHTALHAAFEARWHALAPLLLAHGADRTIADDRGRSLTEIYAADGALLAPS